MKMAYNKSIKVEINFENGGIPMDSAELLPIIDRYGYVALFFILWLGFFGVPVPNEVIIMTTAMVSTMSMLSPIKAFVVTYLGVISSLTTLYWMGYFSNSIYTKKFNSKGKKRLEKAKQVVDKYGLKSMCIAYFLPAARHLVPYILGTNKVPFISFALVSYSTAFVWSLIFYISGILFGNNIDTIGSYVYIYGTTTLIAIIIIAVIFRLIRKLLNRKKMNRKWQH
jgi:membrane-associated protein